MTTATLGATTNQSSGTFYGVVDTAANLSGVIAAQIEAGHNKNGAAAVAAATATVSTGAPNVAVSGLMAATVYRYAEVQTDANGTSNVVSGTFTTAAIPPTLSSSTPSGTLSTRATAMLGATTNQMGGTFYGVVDTSANITGITAAQIEAGQNNTSLAATASGNASISSSSPSVAVSGLTASTPYSYAEVQTDSNGTSNVLTGSFTTEAAVSNALGMNLEQVVYYSNEFPFLNIMKQAGANYNFTGWQTGAVNTDSGEEDSLQLDSDGYPLQIPQPGLTSTSVWALAFRSATYSLAPNQSSYYPGGSYTVQCQGGGTVVFSGDASATITCPTGGTFNATPTGNGINISITASALGNHIHNLSIVQTSLVSSYNAGAIFHPIFLAAMSNFRSFRFMDWHNTNNQAYNIGFTTYPASGNTSINLNENWIYPSGTYNLYFTPLSDGAPAAEMRAATFTFGSTAVAWSGGLATGYQNYAPVDVSYSWANRSLPSNAFYSLQDGPPLEVEIALCNTIGANCWFTLPVTASDSYIESFGQLVMSGTGITAGYSPLSSGLTAYVELANEVWNSAFGQYTVAWDSGYLMWPGASGSPDGYAYNRNWYGMRVAQMASDLQTAVGSTLFSRVVPVIGAQAAYTGSATAALATAMWSSGPATNYPIKALAIASYWGGTISTSDCNVMTAVTTPVDDFFAVQTSQTGTSGNGSHYYSSVPSGGWFTQNQGWFSAYASLVSSSYPSLNLVAYEGGQGYTPTSSGTCSGYPAMTTLAERDARMGTSYTTMLDWWQSNIGGGAANIENMYNDVFPLSAYGAWGALESIMQPISPLSGAPAKWQGMQNYIQ
jgi:hypothetical protein